MSKQKKTPTAAAALINAAKASRHGGMPDPTPEAMAELRTVLTHNDASARWTRVPRKAAIELLQQYGWQGASSEALDSLCRRALGRRSYGTP